MCLPEVVVRGMLEVDVYERVVVRADEENTEIMSSTDMHPSLKL